MENDKLVFTSIATNGSTSSTLSAQFQSFDYFSNSSLNQLKIKIQYMSQSAQNIKLTYN